MFSQSSLHHLRLPSFSILLLSLLGLVGLLGQPGCGSWAKPNPTGGPQVVAFPLAGKVKAGAEISLSAERSAEIHYTLDGTVPEESSPVYKGPIVLWASTQLRAIAFDQSRRQGPEGEWSYEVDVTPPQSLAEPPPGNFATPVEVRLRADEDAQIHYTTDGSKPTAASPKFRNALTFSQDTVLQFFAVDSFGNREPVQRALYNFPPKISIWPAPGVHESRELTLYLRTNKPAEIYYRFAHLSPELWFRYQNPITIRHDSDLHVQASDPNKARSETFEFRYGLLSPLKRGDLRVGSEAPRALLTADLEGFGQPSVLLAGARTLSWIPMKSTGPMPRRELTSLGFETEWIRSWDFDGDGLADILIGDGAGKGHLYVARSREQVVLESGLSFLKDASLQAVVPLDFDGDGQLDLFVLDRRAEKSQLWKRQGAGYVEFKDGNLKILGGAVGALAGDWNNDRKVDLLLLPGGEGFPTIFYGDGKGKFQTYTLKALLEKVGARIAWTFAARSDLDADGDMDLVLLGRGPTKDEAGAPNALYLVLLHQLGGQGWKLVYSSQLVDTPVRSLMLADVDTDGYPDVLIVGTQGGTTLLKNILGVQFADATTVSGVRWDESGPVSVGDLSQIGSVSLLVWGSQGVLRMFGDPPRGKFLRLVLRGVRGNRSAIGAKIKVKVDTLTILREIGISDTGPDQADLMIPIGLGDAQKVGPVMIQWPDGQTKEIPAPQINQTVVISAQ